MVVDAGKDVLFATGAYMPYQGGKVQVGHAVRVTPEPAAAGGVRLRLLLDSLDAVESDGDDIHGRRRESHLVRTVAPGETVRVRWGRPADQPADKQVWADITVQPLP